MERLISRLPAWALAVVAVACAALGVVLTFRPFTSVEVLVVLAGVSAVVTGITALVSPGERSPVYRWLLGSGWIVLGVLVLALPHVSVSALAVVVGVALVVDGAAGIIKVLTGQSREPVAEVIGGLGGIVFGALALSWPEVTIFVVAVLFGVRTVLFGLSRLIAVIGRWRHPAAQTATLPAPEQPRRFRRGLRVAARSAGLVIALLLLLVSVLVHGKAPATPTAFYAWAGSVPGTPGELLRSEPLPASAIPGDAQGWRILYTTRTSLGAPAVGSAFVLAPKALPSGPRPVILWDHGTVGIDPDCAPSLFADVTNGIPAVPEVLGNGWVMVAPDYVGMGTAGPTPYLIGTGEAYSALDAARAAHQLAGLSLSDQTVVWGHSQGGHAALWTGRLAASYAPGLKIDGVAALAPATDLASLAMRVEGTGAGTVVLAYALTDYANTYPDVRIDDYVRPGARVAFTSAAGRCLTDPGLVASVVVVSAQPGAVFAKDPASGPLGARMQQNTPTADVGGAPLLVAQGTGDEVINITITEKWVAGQCAAGYKLDFVKYPGLTHMSLLAAQSPLTSELTAWTAARFAHEPAQNTC